MSDSISSTSPTYPKYGYRWVVLIIFILSALTTNIVWVSFSPIIAEAQAFYQVSETEIVLLGASYMIAYIVMNFPACYLIDRFGLKWGVGIGIIITGVFGFIRGIFASNYLIVVISQWMCAIGQPFILNSFTKMASTWFPNNEKTTASGLATIATLIGTAIGMMAPDFSTAVDIPTLLLWYGIICLVAAVLYVIFMREKPPQPPSPYAEKTKVFIVTGYKTIVKNRDFLLVMVIAFLGVGIFNAISTEIDLIFAGFDAGLIGGAIIIAGIVGAMGISTISDAIHKRKVFIIIAMIFATLTSLGLAILKTFIPLIILAAIMGFFFVSVLPVALTYAAEVTYPIPEETSNGMIMWLGQIGGLLFLLIPALYLLYVAAGFLFIGVICSLFIRDIRFYELQRAIEKKV